MQPVSKNSSISTRYLSNTTGDDDDTTAAASSGTDQPHLAEQAEPTKLPKLTNKPGEHEANPADFDQDEFVMFSGENVMSDRRMDDGFVDLPIMQGAGVMAPPKPDLVTKYLSPVSSTLSMHISSTRCIRLHPAPSPFESVCVPLTDRATGDAQATNSIQAHTTDPAISRVHAAKPDSSLQHVLLGWHAGASTHHRQAT